VTHWRRLLEEVVRERRSSLVGYAYLLTVDAGEAEDLLQEALVRTFARRRALPDVHAAEAYVRAAIRTSFLDGLRRRRTRWDNAHLLVEVDTRRSPDDTAVDGLDVRAALATLPARERACVVLRHIDDLTVPAIAAGLGISEGAVKRYLSDGTRALRALLGDGVLVPDEPARPTVPVDLRNGRSAT
jgi:RNA polymerase sigma-70 factor (ECF subfamily)